MALKHPRDRGVPRGIPGANSLVMLPQDYQKVGQKVFVPAHIIKMLRKHLQASLVKKIGDFLTFGEFSQKFVKFQKH